MLPKQGGDDVFAAPVVNVREHDSILPPRFGRLLSLDPIGVPLQLSEV